MGDQAINSSNDYFTLFCAMIAHPCAAHKSDLMQIFEFCFIC
ncbi:MAG: hypothetical protein A4E63_00278 [Syntrophorhabdus sp. PtaU1.Bin050]|nr:MAG: hypothetical protein A4E63_00278 [Syntrophorhabdus sp. PtaU1.Bin050]